jgi:ABC-type glycerol-3-phosphate transport system substrate-binding protein
MKSVKKLTALGLVSFLFVSIFAFNVLAAKDFGGAEITIMLWYNPDDDWREMISNFEKEYNCKVNVIETTWDEMYTKLVSSITAGDPIDVALLFHKFFPSYIIKNLMQPVDPYIDMNDPAWDFEYMENFKWEGKYYGLTDKEEVDPQLIFYNKTMFEMNGLETPMDYFKRGEWTWDVFLELAQELTQDTDYDGTIDQWGFVHVKPWAFILANGTTLVKFTGDGNIVPNMKDPRVIEALQFQQDLIQKYRVSPDDRDISPFVEGKVAMVTNGPYYPWTDLEANMKDEWDIAPFPKGPAVDVNITPAEGKSWGIPLGSQHPEAAVALIKYMLDENNYPTTAIEESYTPEQQEVLDYIFENKSVTRYAGIGSLNDLQWEFWYQLESEGKPVATLIDEMLPVIEAEIAKTLGQSASKAQVQPFEPVETETFESGDLGIFVEDGWDYEYVQVTSEPGEVIDGNYSLKVKLTQKEGDSWAETHRTDLEKVKLPAWHTYKISFDYKILEQPNPEGYIYIFIRNKEEQKFGWLTLTGEAGDSGHFEGEIGVLDNADGLYLSFGAYNGGSYVIDNVSITEVK